MEKCGKCGTESDGNFCPRCGMKLGRGSGSFCPSCGEEHAPDDLFCGACGEPLRERPKKPLAAYLPWLLSGAALVVFAFGIALLVQEQSGSRRVGDPPTGGVIEGPGPEGAGAGARGGAEVGDAGSAAGGGMPSARELASMPPREAADRLFARAMSLEAAGNRERATFFARMGVQAYERVPASGRDLDLRFHVGLLRLVGGDVEGARAEARAILEEDPDDPLGLYLAGRSAREAGDEETAARRFDRLVEVVATADFPANPAWRAHEDLLRATVDSLGGS